mgnify:CR=1 FL=1
MHKNYYFIAGLPRSGSTLLSAILKQNPNFHADIASALSPLCISAIDSIEVSDNKFNIGEEQRKNIILSIFEGYYKHVDKPIIFDSFRIWTKNTSLLKYLFPNTKILCPVRDIHEIIDSFERIWSKNPLYNADMVKITHNVYARAECLMERNSGIIARPLNLLKESHAAYPEMIYFIEYNDLCKNPEKTIRGVYNFLEMPYYDHDYENVEYSNEKFDEKINVKGMHTVRKKVEYVPKKLSIPKDLINLYKNLEFWRDEKKSMTTYN